MWPARGQPIATEVATGAEGELEQRQLRAARNQSLHRDANERIEQSLPSGIFIEFACECSNVACPVLLPLSIEEYEGVRRFPTRFIVRPGHDDEQVERVVDENGRFAVVEKFGVGGLAALKLDPRGRSARV